MEHLLECNEHFSTLEQTFVTLLNLGDFDFILSKCSNAGLNQLNQKRRHLVTLAGLISAAVTHLHGRGGAVAPGGGQGIAGQDLKKTCRGLADYLLPTVQSTSGKRSRELAKGDQSVFSSTETRAFVAR